MTNRTDYSNRHRGGRPAKYANPITYNLTMEEDLLDKLRYYAHVEGVSVADVINMSIKDHLQMVGV
jgi:hypothetical protein